MPLPYQGRIGVRDLASPTLIPNFYDGVVSKNGTLDYQSPAQYLQNNPRTSASANATIGGTVASGNVVTLTLTQNQLPGGALTASYTATGSDTVETVAEGLASAFNTVVRAQLGNALVTAIYATTSEAEVVINWDGPLGNFATLSDTTSGSITVTLSPVGGGLTGGSGPVFCANNFEYQRGTSTLAFYYGKHYELDGAFLRALVRDDQPVV